MLAYDPTGSTPIENAVAWLDGTVLGTLATTVAIVAVAWVGLLMLSGRLDWRRGVTTVLGCFILFGARDIATGLRSAIAGSSEESFDRPVVGYPPPAPVLNPPPKPAPTAAPEVEL